MTDIKFFVMICTVVLVSFGIITQVNLYPNEEPSWQLLKNVVYMPYWQMYGELFLETIEGQETSTCTTERSLYKNGTLSRCPEATVLVPIVLAVYMVLTNIMLMNILIAMFSNTFQKVQANSLLIWKFYRYSLVHEYIERPVLAPPLIVLNHVYRMLPSCCHCCCNPFHNYVVQDLSEGEKTKIAESERKAAPFIIGLYTNFHRMGSRYGSPRVNNERV